MHPFTLERPSDIATALGFGAQAGRNDATTEYIAGGTDMVQLLQENVRRPERLVSLAGLLDSTIEVGQQGLRMGAGATMAEVAAHQDVIVQCRHTGAAVRRSRRADRAFRACHRGQPAERRTRLVLLIDAARRTRPLRSVVPRSHRRSVEPRRLMDRVERSSIFIPIAAEWLVPTSPSERRGDHHHRSPPSSSSRSPVPHRSEVLSIQQSQSPDSI